MSTQQDRLLAAVMPLRKAWAAHHNPGFYDLDAEQPVHITLTKGEWSALLECVRDAVSP